MFSRLVHSLSRPSSFGTQAHQTLGKLSTSPAEGEEKITEGNWQNPFRNGWLMSAKIRLFFVSLENSKVSLRFRESGRKRWDIAAKFTIHCWPGGAMWVSVVGRGNIRGIGGRKSASRAAAVGGAVGRNRGRKRKLLRWNFPGNTANDGSDFNLKTLPPYKEYLIRSGVNSENSRGFLGKSRNSLIPNRCQSLSWHSSVYIYIYISLCIFLT